MADHRGPYRTFLRTRVAPILRELGLRGSGNAFVLPDERYWAIVGFQADWRYARDGIVRFTIDLTVADRADWDRMRDQKLWYPAKPPATGSNGMPPAEVIRIGKLVPVSALQQDRWWTIHTESEHDAVAAEVITALRDAGIPWLKSRTSGARVATADVR